jgi:hypothetical protein
VQPLILFLPGVGVSGGGRCLQGSGGETSTPGPVVGGV